MLKRLNINELLNFVAIELYKSRDNIPFLTPKLYGLVVNCILNNTFNADQYDIEAMVNELTEKRNYDIIERSFSSDNLIPFYSDEDKEDVKTLYEEYGYNAENPCCSVMPDCIRLGDMFINFGYKLDLDDSF